MEYRMCIALVLYLGHAVTSTAEKIDCKYWYEPTCNASSESSMLEPEAQSHRSWSVSDLTNDIQFTVFRDQDGSSSSGCVDVDYTLGYVESTFLVTLLVNTSVTREEDCRNEIFHNTDSKEDEIHTRERFVCIPDSSSLSSERNCQNQTFSMRYAHIFTGCYALRFTIDRSNYVVKGSTFLSTDYKRTEVEPPLFQSYHEDWITSEPSKEAVKFVVKTAVLIGTTGMKLKLLSTPAQLNETVENACNAYNEKPLGEWEISTTDPESTDCIRLRSGPNVRNIECRYEVLAPQNLSYCFEIELIDERCNMQSIWNPPPGGLYACIWKKQCARIKKNSLVAEHNGQPRTSDRTKSEQALLLPVVGTVILIILIVIGTILCVYRSHSRRTGQRIYANTKLRDLRIARYPSEMESVETTDDENAKGGNEDECEAVMLLYARGSPSFMSLMAELREILTVCCGCRVRDWYAGSEWDVVARIGPSAWVADLLRQKYRVVWIDTPRARQLLDTKWRNARLTETKRPYERCHDEEAISDFRDIALPSVLEIAKRNLGSRLALQYTRHFVVRLEGFDVTNHRSEDPFKDLSPNTRYLIPSHLGDLCSVISSSRQNISKGSLKTEETQLRERLIQMRSNNA